MDMGKGNHWLVIYVMPPGDSCVEVSLGGDPITNPGTRVDDDRGSNFSFPIDEAALNNLPLVLAIKSKRALSDRDVDRVTIPLKVLFDRAAEGLVQYPVRLPSGEPGGTLQFTYQFWEEVAAPAKTVGKPVTAHPAHVGAGTAYPPPPGDGMPRPYAHPAGYGYPPQPPYGYAPPPYAYATPPLYGSAPPPYGSAPPPPYGYAPPPYGSTPPGVQAALQPRKKWWKIGLGPLAWILVSKMISGSGDDAGDDAGMAALVSGLLY